MLRARSIVGRLRPGDVVGQTTLLSPRPSRAALRSSGNCRLLRIERDAFLALAQRRPWLGVQLLEKLGGKLSRDLNHARTRQERAISNNAAALVDSTERF